MSTSSVSLVSYQNRVGQKLLELLARIIALVLLVIKKVRKYSEFVALVHCLDTMFSMVKKSDTYFDSVGFPHIRLSCRISK